MTKELVQIDKKSTIPNDSHSVMYDEMIKSILRERPDKSRIMQLKHDIAKKYKSKKVPTEIEILLHATDDTFEELQSIILTKPTRTISGVTPVAIMSWPYPCPHGACTMCPSHIKDGIPMSYTGHEPASMRGKRNNFDSYLQVFNRLEQYVVLGQTTQKIDLIIMGGTFPSFDVNYQEDFIKYAYKAMNDFSTLFYDETGKLKFSVFKEFFELPGDIHDDARADKVRAKLLELKGTCNLKEEQHKNETAYCRCIGLTIETKPDWAKEDVANRLLEFGCTRIELGVQTIFDDVLSKINRGHTNQDTVESIQILKDMAFKINYHVMLGLPLTDEERDYESLKTMFTDQRYMPDMIKIYPCMVMPNTVLNVEFKKGQFHPIDAKEAVKRIAHVKPLIPSHCRVMRVQRDIPTFRTVAGVEKTNLRQYLDDYMKENNIECNCIRCREVGHLKKTKGLEPQKIELVVEKYDASNGVEYFISAKDVKQNILIGFARMRYPSTSLRPEITTTSALIRELHVYGEAVALGKKGTTQHQGWGIKLMQKAEEIARQEGKDKMLVISGIGVREYYKNKLGYHLEGPYMVKDL